MQTFTVQHAVDFSSGTAKIGKCHILEKREDVMAASLAERIEKCTQKNRIKEITVEQIMQLKSEGLTIDEIAADLKCSRHVIYQRLKERECRP